MKNHLYPSHLIKLIEVLKRLPGVGSRSAERFAFHMLNWKSEHLDELANTIQEVPKKLGHCIECGCLNGEGKCHFCDVQRQSTGIMCIIASPKDAFAVEETREYKGLYHVLGALLSPLDGIGPELLHVEKLIERIRSSNVVEVIIALDSTLEGDATALFLKQALAPLELQISRIAFGLPMGSSLEYVDGGTLARALSARARF